MTHHMNLHPQPFEMIGTGIKTIELRLLDDKRKLIKAGDIIVFTNSDDSNLKIIANVKAMHIFPSFDELYRALPLDKCGYLPDELQSASPKDMEAYYSPEKQAQFGVVGIEIELQQRQEQL